VRKPSAEEDVSVIERKPVRVGDAAKEAAVKRAILGDKGSMRLTANQRKSLRGLKPFEKDPPVHESEMAGLRLIDVHDLLVVKRPKRPK
jgi:hypothetical protein